MWKKHLTESNTVHVLMLKIFKLGIKENFLKHMDTGYLKQSPADTLLGTGGEVSHDFCPNVKNTQTFSVHCR